MPRKLPRTQPVARCVMLWLATVASGAAAVGPSPATETDLRPAKDSWRIESWQGQQELPAGGALTVRNPHGNVNARRSERSRADVYGVVQRHVGDPRRARIELHSEPGGVVAEVLQPAGDLAEEPEPWSFRRVDLTVYVPEGAPWRVTTAEGRIDARRLRSDVEASSQSGDIVLILTRGAVNASSKSGDVKVALGEVAWSGDRRIESESGDLSVSVPADADLDLVIDTRGEIHLDGEAPVDAGRHAGDRPDEPMRLRLGKGGRTLHLRSSTGKITLRSLDGLTPPGWTPTAKEG